MKKITMLCVCFLLCSCAESGQLIGGIITLPVKIVSTAAGAVSKYDDDGQADAPIMLEEIPLNAAP